MYGYSKHAEQTLQFDEYLPTTLSTDVSVSSSRSTHTDESFIHW